MHKFLHVLQTAKSGLHEMYMKIPVQPESLTLKAMRGFKRSSSSPCNRISIKFSDDSGNTEEAINLGGQRMEFLRLLMQALKDPSVFEGAEERKKLELDKQGKCV